MWPQHAKRSQKFRNALALLEAGGYAVDLRQDGLVLRASRTGREWLCYTSEDFDTACAFHAWEALGRAPARRSTLAWTDAAPHDPAMQRALQIFYEKGYAIRIARGVINYVDRRGVNQGFHSREEFIAGASSLGSELSGRPQPQEPIRESRAALERRLAAMETRANAAEQRAETLDIAESSYEKLKAAMLVKFDPSRGRPRADERARRARLRKWLLRVCEDIEAGSEPKE